MGKCNCGSCDCGNGVLDIEVKENTDSKES